MLIILPLKPPGCAPAAAFYWGTFACVYAGPWAVWPRPKTKNGIRVPLFAVRLNFFKLKLVTAPDALGIVQPGVAEIGHKAVADDKGNAVFCMDNFIIGLS